MRGTSLLLLTVTLVALVAVDPANAQDAHYWTLQYGPRSSLLGGAVIGSVDDISGTYYNPGALRLASDLAFAVSANVFEVSGVALQDGGGEGVDLGTTRSGLRPSLVAGAITTDILGRDVLAYSAITRARGTQDLEGIAILSGTDIPSDLQLDDLAGLVRYEGEFNDVWAGLTYASAFGSHVGVGVTWYAAFRSQRRRRETITQTIGTDTSGTATLDIAGGKYSSVRTLAKIGAYAAGGPVSAGITLTTPSLHITGSGQLGGNYGAFGFGADTLAVTVQTGLPATYKSPLSVGAGAAVRLGKTRVHGGAEWFDAIPSYVVMQGEDYVSQAPEEVLPIDAVQEMGEVLNWGVGVEHPFSSRVSAYVSYMADNSGLDDEIVRAGLSILPIDISTVTAGADFAVGTARFTLGFGYGWGSKVDQELTNVLQQEDADFQATYVYRSMRFIFGFEIGLR
jgi:hypothetical protein